jgi:hypothetical protein
LSADRLADLVLAAHFGFVLFVVGGFALILAGVARRWAWVRNPWFRWAHFAAILAVALEALAGLACPLTVLEDALRRAAPDSPSFIARWVGAILYWQLPPWVFTLGYVLFAAAVAYALKRWPPRRPGRGKKLSSSHRPGPDPT